MLERLADNCMTGYLLLVYRIQHTLHGSLYILDRLVDDAVQTHVDFSRSAMDFACASGRTLKPIMIALEADASVTSDSLIAQRRRG